MNKTTLMALALAAPFSGVAMGTQIIEAQPATPAAVETVQAAAPAVKNPALAATDPTLASAEQPVQQEQAPVADTPEGYTVQQTMVKETGFFFGVNVGTLGVGLDVGYQINPYLKARVRGGFLKLKYSDTWGDSEIVGIAGGLGGIGGGLGGYIDDYLGDDFGIPGLGKTEADVDFELGGNNYGLMLDYHPFAGHFHLTVGVNYMDLYVDAQATLRGMGEGQRIYELGNDQYRVDGDSGMVGAKCTWDKLQPYIGLGWSSDPVGKFDVYCSFELGVNFMGKGKISTRSSDNVWVNKDHSGNWEPVNSELLDATLHEEASEVYDIADMLIVYPVIQIGVGCRF